MKFGKMKFNSIVLGKDCFWLQIMDNSKSCCHLEVGEPQYSKFLFQKKLADFEMIAE